MATTPAPLLPQSRIRRCWVAKSVPRRRAAKSVSRRWLRAPVSATLNKPTATASCPASRQPHKSGRNTGRFSSYHSQPYRSHSTIPHARYHAGTSPFDRPHPHPVILAAAGIQSPLSQKTWSGYAGRPASQPRRPVQCGPRRHCPTYLDVGKDSGFLLRRE